MPERDCFGCTHKEEWGCYARKVDNDVYGAGGWENPSYLPVDIDGVEMWKCPRQPIHEDPEYWSDVFMYYNLFKKGFLPNGQNLQDQTRRAMDILPIVDSIVSECSSKSAEDNSKRG